MKCKKEMAVAVDRLWRNNSILDYATILAQRSDARQSECAAPHIVEEPPPLMAYAAASFGGGMTEIGPRADRPVLGGDWH